MNTRAFTLALVIAGIAMYMVDIYIEDKTSAIIKEYGEEVTVIVARKDIKELDLIDDSKVTTRAIPKSFVTPGAFRSVKDLENTVALVAIKKGEQISDTRVTYPGAKTGLSRQVSDGKRAFALSISDDSAAGKLIKPGDRVDIIAAVDYSSGRKDLQKVITVLQNVYVLSTGKDVTNALPLYGNKTPREIKLMNLRVHSSYSTVTLELKPDEVQKLTFILRYSSKPSLSLRNNKDTSIINVKPTRLYDILSLGDAVEAKSYFSKQYSGRK